jgi:hypothetical protein
MAEKRLMPGIDEHFTDSICLSVTDVISFDQFLKRDRDKHDRCFAGLVSECGLEKIDLRL